MDFICPVESGIVTYATWQVIQSLPPPLRRDYEELTAESILLYPRKLVAVDGVDYDAKVNGGYTAQAVSGGVRVQF